MFEYLVLSSVTELSPIQMIYVTVLNFLVYVKQGVAFKHNDIDVTCIPNVNALTCKVDSKYILISKKVLSI